MSLGLRKPQVAGSTTLRDLIKSRLELAIGRPAAEANTHDWYCATVLTIRDRIVEKWIDVRRQNRGKRKRVYYLSIEYLIGRLLTEALTNLDLLDDARAAFDELGVDFEAVQAAEPDAALGNGGLGRLAACYLDSMATLGIAGYGYGLRYEHGLFEQRIRDGRQLEQPELWLQRGNPWELSRPEREYRIGFGGTVEYVGGETRTARAVWYPEETIIATTHDIPITGWQGKSVNLLRLWSARAAEPLQLKAFNEGDHVGAMQARMRAEAITRVLYPGDASPHGQELRLRQEYFFTAASLRDIVRRHLEQFGDLSTLPNYAAIQLNDTHPALAVAELMRLLIDEHDFSWDEAWDVTRGTVSFTNHTLLPEALETWPVDLLERVLPRHMQIIYLINWLHLQAATEHGFTDPGMMARISLIDEQGRRRVRMAHLAFIGSHHVNGVSALHTELLGKTVFHDLLKVSPARLVNKTNGISFRRWLFRSNPGLTNLLLETIGPAFLDDPGRLMDFSSAALDGGVMEKLRETKRRNKQRLAKILQDNGWRAVSPDALFDIQVKRIHEYKRQLLNILEAAALYHELRDSPDAAVPPRVKIVGGKAAPGYERAKLIIKLAHDIGRTIAADSRVRDRLQLIFVPNYSVSLAECLIPAADLSEQISTAGMEASGTGNMKLALNGALTIGTLDGANIEIRERVGSPHFFLFGMTAGEVEQRRRERLEGAVVIAACPRLKAVVESIARGEFSDGDGSLYEPLLSAIQGHDPYMIAADFDGYWTTQREVDEAWQDADRWARSSIHNIAGMGFFSSDRAVREYANDIWRVAI